MTNKPVPRELRDETDAMLAETNKKTLSVAREMAKFKDIFPPDKPKEKERKP